jgi:hypothetical protein
MMEDVEAKSRQQHCNGGAQEHSNLQNEIL